MDASAFDDDDTAHVDASAVLQCMGADLSLPLAGAVAIVVHIVRLAILVLALFACVVLYCFTLTWLVHLWLQTSLLTFAATLLRSCVGHEAAVKGADLHAQRRVPLPSEQWLEEPEPEPEPEPLRNPAEAGRSHVKNPAKLGMVEEADTEPDHHSRTHDTSVEHVLDASESSATRHEPKPLHRQEPLSSIDLAQKPHATTLNISSNATLPSELGHKFLASNQETAVTNENAVSQKILPAPRPALTDQEEKAVIQTYFIEGMKAGTPNRALPPSVEVPRPRTTYDATISRSNPFNVTAEQLAEASSFMSTASRDYESKRSTVRHGPRSATPRVSNTQRLRSHRPAAQPQKPAPASVSSVSTAPDFIPPHVRKSMQAKALRAASEDLLEGTSGDRPVTVRQTFEKPEGDIHAAVGASSVPGEAAKMVTDEHDENQGGCDEKLKAELICEIKASTVNGLADTYNTDQETTTVFDQPFAEPEHEAVFSRKQPSHAERLNFYDSTPELVQPANRAMTATALQAFQTTSSRAVDDRIDSARSIIEGLEANQTSPTLPKTFFKRPIRGVAQADAKMAAEKEPSGIAHTPQHLPVERSADAASTPEFTLDTIDLDLGAGTLKDSLSAESSSAALLRLNIEAPYALVPSYPAALGAESISHEQTPSTTPIWHSVDASDTVESPGVPAQQDSTMRPTTSSGIGSTTPLRPPGLDNARLENLDAFDGLLSNSLVSPPTKGKLSARSTLAKSAELADLEEFSRTFRVPFEGRGGCEDTAMAAETELELIKEEGDQASLSTGGPVQDIEDDVPSTIATNGSIGILDGSKRQAKEQRRLARDNLKEAWLEREEARTKVLGTWSLDGMQQLEAATRSYHEARDALIIIMPSGNLNEEDCKCFPAFSTSALTAPKVRPSGMKVIKSRREAKQSNASSFYEKDSDSSSEIESLKDNMMVARKLREDAVAFQRSARPNTNIAYRTWKETAIGKLKRANLYYNSKRKALAAACPGGVLPSELEAQFPEIL
ncbi:hypothetical protein AC579_2772 [Pseudocercospora musae]|uniref:Uncharacterized protein n=1 Tax=Pseudocercospora musae TaxID=113226 RepID=A0A139IHY0_9PEZI|nr:hypothetical protein AC579_2772 [Pseudocercospora musae]KXT14373.1 hypothetical protein AC579_2772 [Pseudocercospora musae]